MAQYTSLIAAWEAGTVPNGVTGSPLVGTTAQKLALINAWEVSGSAPAAFTISGIQIANLINWAEFAALTAQQQSNVLMLCNQPGMYIGGSAETTHLVDGMIIAYFPPTGPTMVALTALAQAVVQPWWEYEGYANAFSMNDLEAAGGLT